MLEQEKELLHKPYITLTKPLEENKEAEFMVQVGRIPHPMEVNHHIDWIEIYKNGELLERVDFDVSVDREAKTFFSVVWNNNLSIEIKAQCNIHGTWSTEINKDNIKDLQIADSE